ncbi:hypothetical protein RM96_35865 [Cupriavidus sp. IDO]|nr:hypothetical protein RM96_35865 [Cupriavidus sp. IDO]
MKALGHVIPLMDVTALHLTENYVRTADVTAVALPVQDTRPRPLRDLRIPVTDHRNFRSIYCMPKEVFGKDSPFLPRAELLILMNPHATAPIMPA